MSFRDILYSDDRRHRLARHGLLWLTYAAYFTLQSYFPTGDVRGISGYFVFSAFISTAMYFPFCFCAAYLLLNYLYPRYLRWGRHLAFAWRFIVLMLLGFGINYLTGILFFRITHRESSDFFHIFFLGVHNTFIAMVTSVSILGLRLGRNAWLQHEANIRLAAQKARAELQLLKTRIDPQMLFRTLEELRGEVARKAPGAPAAILRLSEDLSTMLYRADGELSLASDEPGRSAPEPPEVAAAPTRGINGFIYKLFFSPRPAVRVARHLLFWLIRLGNLAFLYHAKTYVSNPPPGLDWVIAIRSSLPELFGEILLTYGIAYGLFPLLFEKRKYWLFAGGSLVLLLLVFSGTFNNQMGFHFPHWSADPPSSLWIVSMQFIRTGFSTWLLFIAWQLNKRYFQRIRERVALSKEKADVEFQLLKAQIHPHFLFNTLNNIYSFALDGSPRAEELLVRLASMMRYIIYDCEADRMPLDRELHLLEDYIGLERARYGQRLDLQVSIQGDVWRRRIAPLLMIPFVENCFKHGASQVLEHPWVNLKIRSSDGQLDFRLSNNRPPGEAVANGKSGIGLKNIRQRLDLLYPNRYSLEINSAGEVFSVRLLVPLEEQSDVNGQ